MPNPGILRALQEATDPEGRLRFDRFVEIVLYHPKLGYYAAKKLRVGRGDGTDFATASTVGPLFGELVIEAAAKLLPENADPGAFRFIEIGAEPGQAITNGLALPFAQTETRRPGEPLDLEGPIILFSNELFDAQPFRRFVWTGHAWQERGIQISDTGLEEASLPTLPEPELPLPRLPDTHEGYALDLPTGASQLLQTISEQPWTGLFLAFDYGHRWTDLIENLPQGTARAYHRQRQHNDLLAHPGEQDLTCHVCWDHLQAALEQSGFTNIRLQRQEAFFMEAATRTIQAVIEAPPSPEADDRRGQLRELIHPTRYGHAFQVLSAKRISLQNDLASG